MGETDLDPEDAAQIGGPGLGGGQVDGLALGHKRADPVGLGSAVDRRLEPFRHLADAGQRQDGGGDRGTARRLFVQARYLKLAVLGQLQGARDGGGRHGQQMDATGAGIALGLQPLALIDAEPVLFVDHGQRQPVEADGILEQGMGADGDPGLARGQGGETCAALGRGVAAGQEDRRDAGGLQHGGQSLPVLTGEDLRGRHQGGLEAGGGRVGEGEGGDRGLARADVALQQSAHLFARGQVTADLGDGLLLGSGQFETEGGQQPGGGLAGGDAGAGGDLARPATAGERELVGQKLVIGQPLPGRGVGFELGLAGRGVQGLERGAPAGPAGPGQPCGVLPLRQVGGVGEGGLDQFADHARRQAGGRGIDRLDRRDLAGLFRGEDVRVDDLDLGVEAFDLAGDQPLLAPGQQAVDVLGRAAEPYHVDKAGVVGGPDLDRDARFAGNEETVDHDLEDADLSLDRIRRRHRLAHDQARRGQEGQVADQRPGQFLDERQDLRPHALQAGNLREQGKENLRPHGWAA